MGDWRHRHILTANSTDMSFEGRPIHPFLAEYDYRLSFTRDGKTKQTMLFTNTGGNTHFNLYMLENGCLWMEE